jgi:hypothetical protein
VEYYLLECRNYKEPKKKLWVAAGTGKWKVGILLGDPTEIKTHNCVRQRNREIKQLDSKVYIDSKAGYGGRASMDGSK